MPKGPAVAAKRPRRRPGLGERLRRDFLTGLAVVLPAGLTVMLVIWALGFVDEKVTPFLPGWLGEEHVAGIGLAVFLALTTLVGASLKGYAGRRAVKAGEALLHRLPVVGPVYVGAKQIIEAAVRQGSPEFGQPCLLEYPTRGMWTVVLTTAPAQGELPSRTGEADMVAVVVPTAPNPITGLLVFAPRRDLIPVDISLEDTAKLVMSAGLIGPPGYAPDPGSGNRR